MNGIGIGIGIDSGIGGFNINKDLALQYTSRSGLDLLETKSGLNLNAKILPSCGQITTTSYATLDIDSFEGADQSGYIECRFFFNDNTNVYRLFSIDNVANTSGYFSVSVSNKKVNFTYRNGTTPAANTLTSTNSLSLGWNIIKWDCDGTTTKLYINGVETTYSGTDAGIWLADCQSPNTFDNISIGAAVRSTISYSTDIFKIDYVNYSNKHKWVVTGEGTKIFDVIGTNHLTWVGTNHIAYDAIASSYLLDNGFSIWAKSGQVDEYVPYKSGSPIDTSLGLIGYEKRADYVGGAAIYNYAPSLVDFDYTDGANALLASLDKSNTTYHIDSATMDYYDAANKYRWRQDELANPRVYSEEYKNIGYRGLMCLKSVASNGLLLSASEILVFSVDKTGSNQWNIAKYCTIDSIVAKSGGMPIYDANDYITYNPLPTDLTALSICFIGDSTMGSHASGLAQFQLFNTYTQFSTYNIALSGDTLSGQLTKWNAISEENKLLFDYVLIQLGLNDLALSNSEFTTAYQSLIDGIRSAVKGPCKIVASTMTPCAGIFGGVPPSWINANISIEGEGQYPVLNVDIVNTLNTSDLNDGSDYLLLAYDYGDGLHPNRSGRLVIFNNYLPYIVR